MRRILFAHKNFPAQFGALGEWLAGQGWEVAFVTQRAEARHADASGSIACADHRAPAEGTHRYLPPVRGAAVITGQAFARAAVALADSGFVPDIVMAHAGWGAGTFLKDVWPQACADPLFRVVLQLALSPTATPYDTPAADPLDARARNRVRNAPLWADFSDRRPRALPDPLPGGAVPRLDARAADGDARRRRHRRCTPRARARAILARWGVPRDRRGADLDHPRHGAAPRLPRDDAGAGAAAAAAARGCMR